MSDPRILIVQQRPKQAGHTWFGRSFRDAKDGHDISLDEMRQANLIAEVRPAGFYFIWKDRGGRSGRLHFGIPKDRLTPLQMMDRAFEIASVAIGRFVDSWPEPRGWQ